MTITTTWNIANLEYETATGQVTTVHYTIASTDGTYNAGAYGSIGVDGQLVIPYKDLRKDTVVGWVKDALGGDKVTEMEDALKAQLEAQAHPTTTTGVPW
jgi:hypothetical protein